MIHPELSTAILKLKIKDKHPSIITVKYSNEIDHITKIFFDDECFWEGNFVYTGGEAFMHNDAYSAIVEFLSNNYRVIGKNIFSTT